MHITDVQAILLSSPMPEPIAMEYYGGVRKIFKRDAGLVRVLTDKGVSGWGPAPAAAAAVQTINGAIRREITGRDPEQIDALRKHVLSCCGAEATLPFGGVEIALYDLLGKAAGCPVYELLGGKVRDRIRLYGSAGMYQPPEAYAREAAAVAAQGFTAYKMRPALGPDEDLRTVQLVRQAMGPDVGICLDAHAWWRMGERSYTPEQIEALAESTAAYGITWLEEPLPPEDRDAYVRLRERGIVPIAAGEHESTLDGFLEIIHRKAVDIAQADVSHHGGFSLVKSVIEACAVYECEFAFHNWGTLLECLANAHIGVCFPAQVVSWLEYPCYAHRGRDIMYPYPLADEILKEPLAIERGDLIVPDGPGLGIEIDESAIERYPFLPGPWTTFRFHGSAQEFAMSGDHVAKWEQ